MAAKPIPTLLALVLLAGTFASPAAAITLSECSSRYKSAQTAGTLNGQSWNDFRKARCGAEAPKVAAGAEPTRANTEKAREPSGPKGEPPAGITFPTAIAAKYASEKPAKARMHTCLDEYKALKAQNALKGLVWIKKGGGYYSFCNAKLKGQS